jgi:Tfp pilus assembly protein PilF
MNRLQTVHNLACPGRRPSARAGASGTAVGTVMKSTHLTRPVVLLILIGWEAFICSRLACGQAAAEMRIITIEQVVELSPAGAATWVRTQTNQPVRVGDRLRTGPNSRMVLLLADNSVAEFGEITEIEVLPAHEPRATTGLRLLRGIFSFFHRDKPGRIRVITRGAAAGVEGTEFVMQVDFVDDVERTTLSLIDGIVRFGNEQGTLVLTNLQQAVAIEGQIPVLTAGFIVNNVLQWAFYYPAVLNLDELPLAADEQQALAESIKNYRAGELLAALANYPAGRQPVLAAERIYYAALLLSVGQAAKAEPLLAEVGRGVPAEPQERLTRLSTALRTLIAAVKGEPNPSTLNPQLSSELLASSYYEQSLGRGDESLEKALALARQSVTVAPQFGFGWARVAELEFSFGRTRKAIEALERSLQLTPRNPQALALKGFLLAAQNKTREAIKYFDQAIAVDASLGNAWLGRGLVRIRRGDLKGGREDLLIAAAVEPQRSVLRSYLGKAYAEEDPLAWVGRGVPAEPQFAEKELALAKQLDPADPTAWLYSALLKQQQNRINEAVEDLETSQDLNENRALYRSQLLLDQDRAVRSANLAHIYRDAGMQDWSLFEASRAVSADYANYSAHLFLANTYDELRDPNRINLRYETPAEVEYLVANLLAPIGAGPLSPAISQQEYSRLFERNRLGLVSTTEYLSRGAWTERGAQFGTFQNTAYALEAFYRTDPGQALNTDFEGRDLTLRVKQQLTPQDSMYAQAIYYEEKGGDLPQYYDPASANTGVRTRENLDPILTLGYHHEWQPGVHTLLLANRWSSRFSRDDPSQTALLVDRQPEGIIFVSPFFVNEHRRTILEIYSAELQQVWQKSDHTLILGGRFQSGDYHFENFQEDPISPYVLFIIPDSQTPVADQDITSDFERVSTYAYHTWQVAKPLALVAGVTYDRVEFPQNFHSTPVLEAEDSADQVSPKAGLIWTPAHKTTLRAAYTRSLSGAGVDQSIQLEPVQVAGFLQSFRSIIPESVGGVKPGAEFETYGLSFEQKFGQRTYLSVAGQVIGSEVDRTLGVYGFLFTAGGYAYTNMSGTHELADYEEKSLTITVNHLIDDHWAVGTRYRLAEADMSVRYPEITDTAVLENFRSHQDLQAVLHELNASLLFNHPSGFFSRFQANWYFQKSGGYQPALEDDALWQFHLFAGYRLPRRKVELQIGLLNITDQDYRLNPLTLYNDLPRERTLAVRLQFSF